MARGGNDRECRIRNVLDQEIGLRPRRDHVALPDQHQRRRLHRGEQRREIAEHGGAHQLDVDLGIDLRDHAGEFILNVERRRRQQRFGRVLRSELLHRHIGDRFRGRLDPLLAALDRLRKRIRQHQRLDRARRLRRQGQRHRPAGRDADDMALRNAELIEHRFEVLRGGGDAALALAGRAAVAARVTGNDRVAILQRGDRLAPHVHARSETVDQRHRGSGTFLQVVDGLAVGAQHGHACLRINPRRPARRLRGRRCGR